MKQVFEGVVRKHKVDPELKVIDGPVPAGWVALDGSNPARLGERYRVTIERIRAALPDGLTWDGDSIRQESLDITWRAYKHGIAGEYYQAVYCTKVSSVPVCVLDAFKAEGLL